MRRSWRVGSCAHSPQGPCSIDEDAPTGPGVVGLGPKTPADAPRRLGTWQKATVADGPTLADRPTPTHSYGDIGIECLGGTLGATTEAVVHV
jgi:hypothetical protein